MSRTHEYIRESCWFGMLEVLWEQQYRYDALKGRRTIVFAGERREIERISRFCTGMMLEISQSSYLETYLLLSS